MEIITPVRTIIIPIDAQVYQIIINDRKRFCEHLDELIERHPEIFPIDIHNGYILFG